MDEDAKIARLRAEIALADADIAAGRVKTYETPGALLADVLAMAEARERETAQ
jgi:hypothetical protein